MENIYDGAFRTILNKGKDEGRNQKRRKQHLGCCGMGHYL